MSNAGNILLIADDEPNLLAILSETLAELGYPIITAKNGRELLDLVFSNPQIAAVLSDMQMPEMTGIKVLQEIRARGIDVPVVFLSGYGNKEIVIESLRLGAMDFIEKPFHSEDLKKIVARALALGMQLKKIDTELELLAKKYKIKTEDMPQFKAIQKHVLLMKMKNAVYFQKKDSETI